MKKNIILKRYFNNKRNDYNIIERFQLSGIQNFDIIQQNEIGILTLEKNIVGVEYYLKNNQNISKSKLELQIIEEIFNDNNIYLFDLSNEKNIKILNKELISENINKNLFKYYEDRNKFSERIHLTVFHLKNLITKKKYLETLLLTETPLALLFLNIYDKSFNKNNELEINYSIFFSILERDIPLKLVFKVDETETTNLKLDFKMKYDDNRMSREVFVSSIREKLNKEMFERLNINFELYGTYILDKRNFKVKEINAIEKYQIGENSFLKEQKISLIINETEIKLLEENYNKILKYLELLKNRQKLNKQEIENFLSRIPEEIKDEIYEKIEEYLIENKIQRIEFDTGSILTNEHMLSFFEESLNKYSEQEIIEEDDEIEEKLNVENSELKNEQENQETIKEEQEIEREKIEEEKVEYDFMEIRMWLLSIIYEKKLKIFPEEEFLEKIKNINDEERRIIFRTLFSCVILENYRPKFVNENLTTEEEYLNKFRDLTKFYGEIKRG